VALVQQLLLEQAQQPPQLQQQLMGHGQAQQAQQVPVSTLEAVLRHLQRPISLQELHTAVRLQQQVDSYESGGSSSSSSEEEEEGAASSSSDGDEAAQQLQQADGDQSRADRRIAVAEARAKAAVKQLRRSQRKWRRKLLRDWLRRRRLEQRQQHEQRQEQLQALLAGQPGGGDSAAPSRAASNAGASSVEARSRQRRVEVMGQRWRKSAAGAGGQQLEPGTPALELLLQQAGLLPQRRPRGSPGEAEAAPFGPQQQGRQMRPASAPLLPASVAFQQQVASAVQRIRPSAPTPAAAAAAAAATGEAAAGEEAAGDERQQGDLEWQLHPCSFTLIKDQPAAQQQQQVQQPQRSQAAEVLPPLPPPHVQAAGAAAAMLLLVQRPQQAAAGDGPSTSAAAAAAAAASSSMPLLRLRQPGQAVSAEASAALLELRQAWG
jgi:hypothetical protein